jgi:ribonuclease P protein component
LLRLKNRAQFEAVLAERVLVRSAHFALHRHPLEGQRVTEAAHRAPLTDNAPAMQTAPILPESAPAPSTRPPGPPLFAPAGLWLGAMVPKRWAKRSVTRHAIKRQIYELGRALLPASDQAAYVLRLRAGFSRELFRSSSSEPLKQAVRAELQDLMSRLPRPARPCA